MACRVNAWQKDACVVCVMVSMLFACHSMGGITVHACFTAACLADDASLLRVFGKLLYDQGAATQELLDGGRPAALYQLWWR